MVRPVDGPSRASEEEPAAVSAVVVAEEGPGGNVFASSVSKYIPD